MAKPAKKRSRHQNNYKIYVEQTSKMHFVQIAQFSENEKMYFEELKQFQVIYDYINEEKRCNI